MRQELLQGTPLQRWPCVVLSLASVLQGKKLITRIGATFVTK